MSHKNIELQNVVNYSKMMLKDAKAGNWENVIDIEVQRSELLEKLFSASPHENDVAEMDDKIRKIIEINRKLEVITLNARDNARTEIMSINKGRNAVKSYSQNGVF